MVVNPSSASNDSVDILLFGTMGTIGATVQESLVSHGLKAVLVDFPQNVFHDEPGYVRKLAKSIRLYNPRVVFPIGNQLAMSRFKEQGSYAMSATDDFTTPVIPIETWEKTALLDSKVGSSTLAASLGILQPHIFRDDENVEFPVIFKRDKSFGGSGVYRPKTFEALERLKVHEAGGFLIEEYIEGEDFSVDALRWDGYFRAECYKSSSRIGGRGPSVEREPVSCPQICSVAKRILDHVEWHGVCGMDFRCCPDGGFYFLECNPRITGGICTQIASGFDIPYIYWQLATGLRA